MGYFDDKELKSRQSARIVDVLAEGRIKGPWDGRKSIYFDGVRVQNTDGSHNFKDYDLMGCAGWANQRVLKGFPYQQVTTGVSLPLKKDMPQTRTINDANADRVRITVSVPALQRQKRQEVVGTKIEFDILIQNGGAGPFNRVRKDSIEGITNTQYQRDHVIDLDGSAPWNIQLVRTNDDSDNVDTQDDLYWESFTTIIDNKINYRHTAVMGVTIDAENFASIPNRVYDIGGSYINIPTNYNPLTRNYDGPWNGNFKEDWSDNAAWCFNDIITKNRYGLGDFIRQADLDKWELYEIGKWCDEMVDDGKGGHEPRFTCNLALTEQQEAFDVINLMASIFRGNAYWAGGLLVPLADKPRDVDGLFNNANVMDGVFNYSGSDIRARHNQVQVPWADPDNLGKKRIALVEDPDSISRYGIQPITVPAVGCVSESQAIRVGKWVLYTENYEGEAVSFSTGLQGAWVRPGHIIEIADAAIAGARRGGRIEQVETRTKIILDASVILKPGVDYYLSCVLPDGTVEMRSASGQRDTPTTTINLGSHYSTDPVRDAVWVLASADLETTMWRVINATHNERDRYDIEAIAHNPSKWAYVDKGRELDGRDTSNIGGVPPVYNLNAIDYLVALSPISVGSRMLVSWTSKAAQFEFAYRQDEGNWKRTILDQTTFDFEVKEEVYEITVRPMNLLGKTGDPVEIKHTVIGRTEPPARPNNFRVQQVTGVAMFQWAPSIELDVLIGGSYEMRYSPRLTEVGWASANTVLASVPGTATTVELPYRPGTYLLKSKDITGLWSNQAASIIISGVDQLFHTFVRICEQPAWLGVKTDTVVQMPQQWIVLAPNKLQGYYAFYNVLDIGGVFSIRLTVDMLAFPFIPGTSFIDERPGLVDTWQSWDDYNSDGNGMVTVQVRQTDDDPASGTANWSEWGQFVGGDYTGRGFQFKAWLAAPVGQNIAIEQLCIIADVYNKHDNAADVDWVPNKMRIDYDVKFYDVPSISIAIQNGIGGDTYRITNKSRNGFDLELLNAGGGIITGTPQRKFDWIATGY